MVKIILIISIFSIFTFAGYIYGESFRKRLLNLNECYKGVLLLQNEVVFNTTPLPEALYEISKKSKEPFNKLISNVSDDLRNGEIGDVYIAFKENYEDVKEEVYLNKEDKDILGDFLKSLGYSGVYGQEKIFNLALENLKINIKEAGEESKKNTKLYRYLGMCFGAMISIFLL